MRWQGRKESSNIEDRRGSAVTSVAEEELVFSVLLSY